MRATIEQAIEAIAELLTATHDHGSWKPGIVISYLGPNFDNGEGWYVSLTEYKEDRHAPPGYPVKSVIFKGKYQTLREGLKAAAEFLAPTKLDELKTRVQALAEKL
jgi:hypothetical protein